MYRRLSLIAFFTALAGLSSASGQIVRAEADILSPGDEGYEGIPNGRLVIDVFVDIAATDVWTAAGIRAITQNQAQFMYFDGDSNVAGTQPGLFNPGLENRYLSSLSRPRPRNADARFTNTAAGAAGGYTGGASPITQQNELNVAYFAMPPMTSGSPSIDGWIARLSVDVSATGHSPTEAFVTTTEPSGLPVLVACGPTFNLPGMALATYDWPQLQPLNFWVVVPEPATPLLLIVAGFFVCRRRART